MNENVVLEAGEVALEKVFTLQARGRGLNLISRTPQRENQVLTS